MNILQKIKSFFAGTSANQHLEVAKPDLEEEVKKRTAELEEAKASLGVQLAKKAEELQAKIAELERFNKLVVGRELKMVELKEEIAKLKKKPEEEAKLESTKTLKYETHD